MKLEDYTWLHLEDYSDTINEDQYKLLKKLFGITESSTFSSPKEFIPVLRRSIIERSNDTDKKFGLILDIAISGIDEIIIPKHWFNDNFPEDDIRKKTEMKGIDYGLKLVFYLILGKNLSSNPTPIDYRLPPIIFLSMLKKEQIIKTPIWRQICKRYMEILNIGEKGEAPVFFVSKRSDNFKNDLIKIVDKMEQMNYEN